MSTSQRRNFSIGTAARCSGAPSAHRDTVLGKVWRELMGKKDLAVRCRPLLAEYVRLFSELFTGSDRTFTRLRQDDLGDLSIEAPYPARFRPLDLLLDELGPGCPFPEPRVL